MRKTKALLAIAVVAFVSPLFTCAAPLWPDRDAPIIAEGVNGMSEEEAAARRLALRDIAVPTELYRAGEFQTRVFGSASVTDIGSIDEMAAEHEAGVGIGFNYFFTRNFGVGYEVRGNAKSLKSDWLNEGGVSAFYRVPLWRFAPYGVAGVGYEVRDWKLRGNVYAGAGVDVALSSRVSVFGELRRVWEGRKRYDAIAGVSFRF